MHDLTRPMSEMYCWQSRIASGSQAARCCGVHCCAAAGEDANVSERPRSAAAAMIGRRFGWVRTCIIDPPSVSVLVSIVNATTMASSVALLATVILPENSAMYFSQCLAHIWPGASSLNHLVGAGEQLVWITAPRDRFDAISGLQTWSAHDLARHKIS
jgi:hypothetical protein